MSVFKPSAYNQPDAKRVNLRLFVTPSVASSLADFDEEPAAEDEQVGKSSHPHQQNICAALKYWIRLTSSSVMVK